MKIKEFNYDLENGFAWIIVEGGPFSNSPDMTIQCCLQQESYDEIKGPTFKQTIICGDCGHNWGISGELNIIAFKYWGENRSMNALFNSAKRHGFDVIGL